MKRFKDLLIEALDKTLDNFDPENPTKPIPIGDTGKDYEQDFWKTNFDHNAFFEYVVRYDPSLKQSSILKFKKENPDFKNKDRGSEVVYAFTVGGTTKQTPIGKDFVRYVPQIIKTSMDSIEAHIKGEQPSVFSFTGDNKEPSRVKLYDRIFKQSQIPGFTNLKMTDGSETIYLIMRNDIKKEFDTVIKEIKGL